MHEIESDDVKVAMRQSAKASSLATRASFNHEMLAMLYFPDEHKWAVYTPLFGPIGEFDFISLESPELADVRFDSCPSVGGAVARNQGIPEAAAGKIQARVDGLTNLTIERV